MIFDSRPQRYVKMQPARYRSRIQNEIASMQAGGGTEFFGPLDMAYQDISVVQARKKHVILLTDGNADSNGLRDLVQAMLADSITVTTVGSPDETSLDVHSQDLMRWESRPVFRTLRRAGATVMDWNPNREEFALVLMRHLHSKQ